MSNLGLSVMLHRLSNESGDGIAKYYGLKITKADFTQGRENCLTLEFGEVGKRIHIVDGGQSCCESRYITTDDDVQALVGGILRRIETKEGPEMVGEWGDTHEMAFIEIGTEDAHIVLTTHNEHNGYYGGFALTVREETI